MDAYDIDSYWWPDTADFHELEDYWPSVEDVPPGRDVFAGEPVSGLPDNETLARLVADANLTPDDGNE